MNVENIVVLAIFALMMLFLVTILIFNSIPCPHPYQASQVGDASSGRQLGNGLVC
jgi:hypothetical protein